MITLWQHVKFWIFRLLLKAQFKSFFLILLRLIFVGNFYNVFVLLLDDVRVDECSNEDPGPLPGPRYFIYRMYKM